jgi:hypothetical protein
MVIVHGVPVPPALQLTVTLRDGWAAKTASA